MSVVLRVCVGRVDKWKRGGGGLSAKGGEGACQRWFPLLLFFSSFVERMAGLESATFALGWWCFVG